MPADITLQITEVAELITLVIEETAGASGNTQISRYQAGQNYTLKFSDWRVRVCRQHTAALSLTMPPESAVPWPDSAVIVVRNDSDFDLTPIAGAGVTLKPAGLVIPANSDFAFVKMTNTTNLWHLV